MWEKRIAAEQIENAIVIWITTQPQCDNSFREGNLNVYIIPTVASNNPCSKYKTLNAADRLITFTAQSSVRCDQRDLNPGWYRFTGVAGDPKMPTTCPPVRRCGTHAPGWIKGQHPSVADGEVTREVCYHWSQNCCRWKNNIKVKNCGAFYVYELQKTPVCSLRYCGEYKGYYYIMLVNHGLNQ